MQSREPVAIPVLRSLTPAQRQMLAAELRDPLSPALNMALLVRFAGEIDQAQFSKAFEAVVRSSDVLRTTVDLSAAPRARVVADPPRATEEVAIGVGSLDSWVRQVVAEPIPLAETCYRSILVELDDGTTAWLLIIHHIATDATSSTLVVEATVAAYLGDAPEPQRFYSWFAEEDAQPAEPAIEYWSNVDQSGEPTTGRSGRARRRLVPGFADTKIQAALETDYRCLTPDLSVAAFLATSTAVLLSHTNAGPITIGIPLHHRNSAGAARLIGPTLNVYPIRTTSDRDISGRDLHQQIVGQLLTALRYSSPRLSVPSRVDAIVNVLPSVRPASPPQCSYSAEWIHPGSIDPDHLLRVHATSYNTETSGRLALEIDVPDDGGSQGFVESMPALLDRVMTQLAATPDSAVGDITMLSAEETTVIRSFESGPHAPAPTSTVGEELRRVLSSNPRPVLRDNDQELTGAELWQWVESLAAQIDARYDRYARIGVEIERSVPAVVAIFAIVVAGRTFVPIDTAQPEQRRKTLLRRINVAGSFTDPVEIEAARRTPAQPVSPVPPVQLSDDAYVLFTSGSTGQPKAVPITHAGLAGYIDFALNSYFDTASPSPVAPLFTSLGFDLTLTSLFAPILRGGMLHVVRASGAAGLAELAHTADLNWCKATPSHLAALLPLLGQDSPRFGHLVVGGEAFTSSLAQRLVNQFDGVALFNEYGPTEAVVGCMLHRVDTAELNRNPAVSIGMPGANVELRVVDSHDRRTAICVPGELLVSHPGLTVGYLDEQDGAADRFVRIDDKRFYRSGDVVVRSNDGKLTYLGRVDDEVKVGGIRLNPVEIEQALEDHPEIANAHVRMWAPGAQSAAVRHCVRCGLPDTVPHVVFDGAGVCDRCHAYDKISDAAASWFKNPVDLVQLQERLRARRTGDYDVVFLLSGGKDSTYGLYKLIELGFEPVAITYDNGFISEAAKRNIEAVIRDLGVDHIYATSDATNDLLRDSLANFSDVCHGCYKAIYTFATNFAVELGAAAVVTGLSRGQLFETRLIPAQFDEGRFDAAAIDQAVISARRRYHQAPDLTRRLLDTAVFDDDDLFDRVEFVDLYRYLDVELGDVLTFLNEETPWRRPEDTGRSSNCLVNVVGIRTHQIERGYHNYAEPYAWDVRLGHKHRAEAMAELDDPIDDDEIRLMLDVIGYEPRRRELLTAWFVPRAGAGPTPTELRTYLAGRLPEWAVPAAFVPVDALTLNTNGKVATEALPSPQHRSSAAVGAVVDPATPLERVLIERWQAILGVEPLGVDDDFFAVGGDSLAAIAMIIQLSESIGTHIPEEVAFMQTTVRKLAATIAPLVDEDAAFGEQPATTRPTRSARAALPDLNALERTLLYEQHVTPNSRKFNIARRYSIGAAIDVDRFSDALRSAAMRHEPFRFSFGSPRRVLSADAAVEVTIWAPTDDTGTIDSRFETFQRVAFDLENGPLVRCAVQLSSDTTHIVIAMHHISGDHQSLDILWRDVDRLYSGLELDELPYALSDLTDWQSRHDATASAFWLSEVDRWEGAPSLPPVHGVEPDGYLSRPARISESQLRFQSGRTPVVVSLAACAAAVQPFFAGDHVDIALVSSARTHADSDQLCGYLLNPLPFHLPVVGSRMGDLIDATSTAIGRALPHRAYPFSRVCADARGQDRVAPSASILLSYVADPEASLDGTPAEHHMLFNGDAVAELSFFVEVRAGSVTLGLEYDGSIVSRRTAELLLDRFDQCLDDAIENLDVEVTTVRAPHRPLSILYGDALDDRELLLPKIVRQTAERSGSPAVRTATAVLTWAELGARAQQVAVALQTRGVSQGDHVVVCVPRTELWPVAALGTLLVGAVYVPVDASDPARRIKSIIDVVGANAAIVAGSTEAVEAIEGGIDSAVSLSASGVNGVPWTQDGSPTPAIPADGTLPAYVIFTSGSTGVPNGVSISHQQIANSTNARAKVYPAQPQRFAVVSSIAFDSSLVGLFWTLARGGELLLPGDGSSNDPDAIAQFFEQTNPTHLLCVPTLYSMLLRRRSHGQAWPEHVIVAGEACPAALVEQHQQDVPTSLLTNEYGPTEAAIWATAQHLDQPTTRVPIGPPIPGIWTAVLDEAGRPVEEGLPGQLALGGDNIAVEYVGGHGAGFGQTTKEQPLGGADDRYFLTGDRVVQEEGTLYFIGRIGDQMSIGGTRIEPGEIEAALLQIDGVTAAVVHAIDIRPIDELLEIAPVAAVQRAMRLAATAANPSAALRRELTRDDGAHTRVIAHVETQLREGALRSELTALVPPSRLPAVYTIHERLPRLSNGKLDRSALATVPQVRAIVSPVGPAIDVALDDIAEEYARALSRPSVASDGSFFDLGGDSLAAFELIGALERRFRVDLPVRLVHDAPTPQAMLDYLVQVDRSVQLVDDTIITLDVQTKGAEAPIFMLHHVGANARFARALSDQLGPANPVFAMFDRTAVLSPFGAATEELQHLDIGVTVRRYVDAIEARRPTGPLVLIGHCQGGIFVHEAAKILSDSGRDVRAVVVVFDWHAPYVETWAGPFRTFLYELKREDLRSLVRLRWIGLRRQLAATVNRSSPQAAHFRLVQETNAAYENHEYSNYDGKVLVIRRSDDPRWPDPDGPTGWGDVLGDLAIRYIAGEPFSGPGAEALAALLKDQINWG